ncbi:MAG: ThuA domain-containing protein [Chloroflexota bacterium]|nr:ThuA domain-containing protein [Chloroflexota bacterium]
MPDADVSAAPGVAGPGRGLGPAAAPGIVTPDEEATPEAKPWWMARPRPQSALVVSGRWLHDSPDQTALLKEAIGRSGIVHPYVTETWGDATAESLDRYALIVIAGHYDAVPDPLLLALRRYVESGRPLLGLHAANSCFTTPDYVDLIGSRFTRHDPIKEYTVQVDVAGHPLTAGLTPFRVVDELREGEFQRHAIEVVASAEGHPVAYWKALGRGRIVYIALGHDRRSLAHPSYLRLVENAISWLLSPSPPSPH